MKLKNTALLGGLCLATLGNASAVTWAEVGDAGDVFTTGFQVTSGVGVLDLITGDTTGDQVDAFLINITDPAAFYATTDVAFGSGTGGASYDTMLSLFLPDGTPVLNNDDSGGPGFVSYLSDPSTFTSGSTGVVDPSAGPLAAGDYILAISTFNFDATDGVETLFVQPGAFTDLFGPNPAAGAGTGWVGGAGEGTYSVELGGATFAVPEPTTGLLSLIGLAGFLRRRR